MLLMRGMICELKKKQATMQSKAIIRLRQVMMSVPVLRDSQPRNDETAGSLMLSDEATTQLTNTGCL